MLEKDTPGADIGPRTLEWHSVLVIDESAMALAQTRDHARNRSANRGAEWSRAMTKIVLFTKFGGPLTSACGSATDAEVEGRP